MTKFTKAIGIVGGAGPMASAFLYSSIIRVCQERYKANDYAEFPEIIVFSYPFTRGNPKQICAEIEGCLSKLKTAGASLFCLACHSFHGFLPAQLPTGFVHLVKESVKEAKRLKISRALILSSETTIRLRLYETPVMECVYPPPDDQHLVNQLIREVAGGNLTDAQSKALKKMIARLQKTLHFDGIVLACTELPLLHAHLPVNPASIPIVDTIHVLSDVLVAKAVGKKGR